MDIKSIIKKTKDYATSEETKEKINKAKSVAISGAKKAKTSFDKQCEKLDSKLKEKMAERKKAKEEQEATLKDEGTEDTKVDLESSKETKDKE